MSLDSFLKKLRKGPAELGSATTADDLAATAETLVAQFSPQSGTLTLFGDGGSNALKIGRDAAGKLQVNDGSVPIQGGTATVANTALIQAFGQGGDDVITLDESRGALPRANLFGGTGNDSLTGGSGSDMLFGQSGNDTLMGKGGDDLLFGGADDDVLTGGDGNDQMFGESGNDRMIWNPGDDSDLMEGGAGTDTAEVNGGGGREAFSLAANGSRVRLDRLDPAPFSLDIGTTERLVVSMNGGDDSFSATGNLAALIQLTVDGGAGNDTILGGNGADILLGGDGDDLVDGNQGNDVALLGAGNDTFRWDPGDGSDVVEGQAGSDTLDFNGSNGSEAMALQANGGRVLLNRNLGNIVMDLDDVERVQIDALGGADAITVGDLSGTDVAEVAITLAAATGGGDGQADAVIVSGTSGSDVIDVFGAAGSAAVVGLEALVTVSGAEGANDSLVINAGGGDDAITATSMHAGVLKLTLDGGAGDDAILGSQGADVILGGSGDDFVFGDNGDDVALLGSGNDVFLWNPGDGSDVVEGQDGTDTLQFFGSNVGERVDITANGGRARLFRDVANVTMDLNDVETIEYRALGGADAITVGDLSGTDVTNVDIDLRGPSGGPDGASDSVTVNATQGSDVLGVTGDAGGVRVFGLHATVDLFHTDGSDRLTLNGLGGDDVIDASSLEAGAVVLAINGGLGNDVILGSEGGDTISGGDGADVAFMGAGDDTFVWNPGDDNDIVEGQSGFDTLNFNGSNASESITFTANGGRVLLTRDVANVVMDANDVEGFSVNALGGSDRITVGDLSGTDATAITINLAAAGAAGDGAADTVVINATSGDDVIQVFGEAGGVRVVGLAADVFIFGFDAADRLVINGLGGDDVIEASGLAAGSILLTADGGDGDDVLIGGGGADTLLGGAGDDVLIGGPGIDVLNGGLGDNILI